MTLLGASILQGPGLGSAMQNKVDDLTREVDRLKLLHANDALVLLKNSLTMSRLLYILRTSDCHNYPLLRKFVNTLTSGLSSILNVQFNDIHWLQASLAVKSGGIGLTSEATLAPSAF